MHIAESLMSMLELPIKIVMREDYEKISSDTIRILENLVERGFERFPNSVKIEILRNLQTQWEEVFRNPQTQQ